MYWADKIAKQIIESGKFKPYWVDDMYTPSGYAHIGSLRGPIVHDLVYKALNDTGYDAKYTFVLNDFDPVDGIPPEFEYLKDFLGLPLKKTPPPSGSNFENFADFIAYDLKETYKKLGIEPEYLSSWEMYKEGRFNEAIKIALNNSEEIQNIYKEVSGSKKKEKGWLPLQVICENCGKIGTTRVYDWDGKTVAYKCEPSMVEWAKGCGFEGRVSPFDGNGKLPWKVDWPAHWMVLGVSVEGSGKDHSSAGGSRDIARKLVKKVFKIPEPYNLPYEFFLIGGKKMASSKGLGLKARAITDLLPPELVRFLFCRTDFRQQVNFDPAGTMAIPDLFDEYDRCFKAYLENGDEDLSRTFEMSQIGKYPPKEKIYLPRFRDVVNYLQQVGDDLKDKFEAIKGGKLTDLELKLLEERIKYGRIWLDSYAPDEFKFNMSEKMPDQVKQLTKEQKQYLNRAADLIEKEKDANGLQKALYNLSKEMGINTKSSFASIYISLIGKEHGPKAGSFLLSYPKEKVIQRLKEAAK